MMKLITFNFVDVSSFRLWRRARSIRLRHVKFAGIAAVMLLAAVSVRLCDRRKALLHEIRPGFGSGFDTQSIQSSVEHC